MRPLLRVSAYNFLSLKELHVELADLTVLVGPNGAGKTNLLNVFRFLGEVARADLSPAIDAFGGYRQLLYRGDLFRRGRMLPRIEISIEANITSYASEKAPDIYTLRFFAREMESQHQRRQSLFREEELVLKRTEGRGRRITLKDTDVKVEEYDRAGRPRADSKQTLKVQAGSSGLSILRRLGDRYSAPQVNALADVFEDLRLFDVSVDAIRRPSRGPADYPVRLNPNASNLGAFIMYLRDEHPGYYKRFKGDMQYVYPPCEDIVFIEHGGNDSYVTVAIKERGIAGFTPLARASFGTVRAFALFAMLNDPDPPKLTCLEEIDHGLYPHALDRLVDRLRDASKRTQLIVATHSPSLVNRLAPEELIILEREEESAATVQPDITAEEVRAMEKDSGLKLGELWFSGALSGS